mgnify:CR=1 FL=1
MTLDFDALPDPQIIEELDFELYLEAALSDLQARDPAYTEIVESDPGVKVLEVAVARETILRARVNDALRGTLVRFAVGADLDNRASNYQVERLPGETDEQLRIRLIERIRGSSAAGSAAWYRFHALTADPDVGEVGIDSPGPGVVRATVRSRVGDGVPTPQLLAVVEGALQDPAVRVVTDSIVVAPPVVVTVPITATVYLLPEAPIAVFNGLASDLQAAFAAEASLGWDVTPSWVIGVLQAEGVQRVELASPAAVVSCDPTTLPLLGEITLTFGGRDR